MSAFNNGGGGFGSPRGLPEGINQAQLDEIKSFNAGLTQAGNKSRPSRSRGGGGINRGIGSGISSARMGGSYSSASSTSGSGNGAGYGGGVSYSVGPTTSSPIGKPARETVPIHLRGVVDVSKTRWANLDSTGAGTSATPSSSRSRSPTRSSILTAQHPLPSPPKLQQQQQPPAFQPLQNVEQGQNPIARIPTPPGRVRIVTNMTPDDPSKPFIPAHLRQTSCRKKIEDIARMTGIPLSEITSDGMSIPAHPSQLMNLTSTPAPVAAPRQADVDQQNWLNLVQSTKKQGSEANSAVDTTNMAGNPNVGVVTAADTQPMLSESRWASGDNNTAQQNGFASVFPTAPAPKVSGASGWGAPAQQPVASSQPVPVNNSAGWDSVGNNRWTQAQPDHGFVSAAPTQSAGFGSGPAQVQDTSLNIGGYGGATPTKSAGFGSAPVQGQPGPSNTNGFCSATVAHSAGFGSEQAPVQALSSNVGGFGSANPVQSAGFASVPAQAIPFNTLNNWGQPLVWQSASAQQSGWGAPSQGLQASAAQGMTAPVSQAPSSGGWGNVANQNPAANGPTSGHTRILSQSMSDVEMTGGNSILDTPVGNLDSTDPGNRVLTAMPTLADSRWATPSCNTSQAAVSNVSRPSQRPAQVSASNRTSETVRQPLAETAPGGFSFINTQSATNPTVNNSLAHPFGNIEISDFNNRVARELREADVRARAAKENPTQTPGYGPAHLRPAPQNINRTTPTRSENVAPKKEEKVQTLKDSRWAY